MATSVSNPSLRFINDTGGGGHSAKALSPVQRRMVRSQAMIAVRRNQRQEAERYLRLRWTNPILACKDEDGDEGEPNSISMRDKKQIRSTGKHTLKEVARSDALSSTGGGEGTCRKSQDSCSRVVRIWGKAEGMQDAAKQESSVGCWVAPSLPDLIERFGGGRFNPFESYPIPLSEDLRELLDHYIVVIPHLVYGTSCSKPMQRLLYTLSFDDLAVLCVLMAQASRHLDALHGTTDSPRSLRHATAAVRAVNNSLRSGDSAYKETTIFAVQQLATTERRFGTKSVANQHWLGMKRILEQRGGLQSISHNRPLEATLIWNDLVFARSPSGTCVETDHYSPLLDIDPEDRQEETRHRRIFDLCDQLESISCKSIRREDANGFSFQLWKQRLRVFSKGSILHITLFGEPEVTHHLRSQSTWACQNSCLVYFAVAFLNYADKPDTEELFLRALDKVAHTQICRGHSPEMLIALLVMGLIDEDAEIASLRARKVMRLMLEVKELDSEACTLVRERLWRSVSLSFWP